MKFIKVDLFLISFFDRLKVRIINLLTVLMILHLLDMFFYLKPFSETSFFQFINFPF